MRVSLLNRTFSGMMFTSLINQLERKALKKIEMAQFLQSIFDEENRTKLRYLHCAVYYDKDTFDLACVMQPTENNPFDDEIWADYELSYIFCIDTQKENWKEDLSGYSVRDLIVTGVGSTIKQFLDA